MNWNASKQRQRVSAFAAGAECFVAALLPLRRQKFAALQTHGTLTVLVSIWLNVAGAALPLSAAEPLPPLDPSLPALTTVQQLRLLPREEARRGYPVKVQAVVTYFDRQWRSLFIEDAGAGCFVFASDLDRILTPGQKVEIEGRSGTGFVPVIHEQRLAVVGETPLPAPRPVSLEQLISGREDCQRVQVQTIIRSMMAEHGRLIIDFGEAGGRFEAHVPNFTATALPLSLLDARVEITGVAGAKLSPQDQPLGVRLYLPSLDAIRVIEASPVNAFDRPAQPIDSLLWFNPASGSGHRIKVTGVVTLSSPSGQLFVQDTTGGTGIQLLPPQVRKDSKGLYLDPQATGTINVGEQVEVIGYPALGDYAPVLRDAWIRKSGVAPRPRPLTITAEEALSGRHDGRLVATRARLLLRETRRAGNAVDQLLTLQAGSTIFDARLEAASEISAALNSLVEVTGICAVQADERRQPRSFRLLLSQAGDLRVIEAPPVGKWQGSLQLLGLVVVVAVLALARLVVLRRRVTKQEERIGSLKREADLRERYRTLFDSLQDLYYRADLNGITTVASPSSERVLGYKPEELIGKPTTMTCVHPWERDKLFAMLMKDGLVNDYEMLLCRKGGDHITISLNAHVVRDAAGKIIATEGFIRDITQRKKAEDELRESQQLLASITHNISEGIYRSTPQKGLIYVNDSFVKMFGYESVEEVLKLPSRALYADAEGRARLIGLIERDGCFNSEEVEFIRKDGSRFWGLTSSIGIFDPQTRQPIYFDGAIIDITDRKRIERERQQLNTELERRITERTDELRQSEERFSKAFHASPAILSILRLPGGQYLDVNEAFLHTFGFQRDEVIGRTSLELNLWQDPAKRAALFEALKAGESVRNQEVPYRTKTGRPKVILHSTELIDLGEQTCVLAVGQDITENKRVNAALAESEAHTRLIIDTALDAVIIMDAAGLIKGWNPQAEAIFGWSSEEALGRNLGDTIIPPQFREPHQMGLTRFLNTGEGPVLNRRIELAALHRSGREFPAELAVTALSVGGSYIFSAFVRDITDRKRAEDELLKALDREKELGKLKSNFVSMVSHEFRTPLGIIMSSAEILDRYLERLKPEQRRDHLQAIHKSVQRMAGMMEEVLVLGRVEAGKMECKPAPIDLVAFCQRLTDELHSVTNRQCPIEFSASPLPGDAEADEGLLRHIFTNLLTNGVKYSRPEEPVRFSLRYKDYQAVFTVEDKGVGIPEADQQWIFKAFHRGQNVSNIPGTGLGLTIVKRCVELHGGKIKCQSTEGVGTQFIVTLPLFGRPVNVGAETALFMNRP